MIERKYFLPWAGRWAARWLLLAAGMFVATLGIAVVTRAGLGTTPISTVPYVVGEIAGISFGMATLAVNIVFVAMQWFLLGKRFKLYNLLQIPAVTVFSLFIDLSMHLTCWLTPESWPVQLLVSLSGNVLMAFGIVWQIASKTIVQPGEGIVIAYAVVAKRPFGTMKIVNDVGLVIVACAAGLLVLGTLYGVREGTVISAVLVGLIVKVISPWFIRPKKEAGDVQA